MRVSPWCSAHAAITRSLAGIERPLLRASRAISEARVQTSEVVGTVASSASISRSVRWSFVLRAPFHSSRRTMSQSTALSSLSRAQESSRIRKSSSWVMKSSDFPNLSVSFWSRRRRLNSEIAITTASRLVFAPVCRIASCSSSSGISNVVFMTASLASSGFHLKRQRNPPLGSARGLQGRRARWWRYPPCRPPTLRV